MRRRKKAGVQTIADAVGVSLPVVSQVLNNKATSIRISSKVKDAVLNEAIRQKFRLNSNIGVIIPYNDHFPYVHEFLCGIFGKANEYGFGTYFASFQDVESMGVPWFLKERKVSGILFLHEFCEKTRKFCEEEKIPYLIVNPIYERPENDCILINEYGMIRELCEHLATKGYKRYFYWTWNYTHKYIQERLQAFKDFSTENTDFHCETMILEGDGKSRKRHSLEIRDLIGREGPETVIMSNDITLMLREFCAWHHKEPGEDIGLACEQNIANQVMPGITTYTPPVLELGSRAVEMMKAKWDNYNEVQDNVVVKGKIIEK